MRLAFNVSPSAFFKYSSSFFLVGVFIIVATILRLVIARHEAIPCNKAIPIGWGLLRQATQGSQ